MSKPSNMSREALLSHITEVSFSAYDTLLFLDTHPNNQDALEHYREVSRERQEAMKDYGKMYGPLTVDSANATGADTWQWMKQPWPWEGGAC